MTNLAHLAPIAAEAVDLASTLMRTHQPGVVIAKGDRDMASDLDYAIEQQVRALLRERTPYIGFLGEEEGAVPGTGGLTWALDPIDGTANFIHGLPLCGISLGLLDNGRPVLGIIDLPFLQQRYNAVEGGGAFAGSRRIHVSTTALLGEAIVAMGDYAVGAGAERKNPLRLAVTQRLAARAQRVRMHGSAAVDLAWLADGKIDATIAMSNKTWDMTAGVIIAREAGATVLDKDGTQHTVRSTATIAANPSLVSEIIELIRQADDDTLARAAT